MKTSRVISGATSFAKKSQGQQGVTLIELLIAMGLSVFMMAAVVQVFLGSKQSSDVVVAQARMQESARFALMFMSQSLRMAGYPSALISPNGSAASTLLNTAWRENLMPANSDEADFQAQAVVWGEEAGSGVVDAKADSDVVHVRLQGLADSSITDCQGNALVDESQWAQFAFFIDDDDNFHCRSVDANGVVSNEVLVEGVEQLQFQYGLNGGDVAGADPTQVVRYGNADDLENEDWKYVVAIKAALVTASSSEPLSSDGPAITYELLDFTTPDYSDGKARQQFAQTVRVRNQMLNATIN